MVCLCTSEAWREPGHLVFCSSFLFFSFFSPCSITGGLSFTAIHSMYIGFVHRSDITSYIWLTSLCKRAP